MTEWPNKIKYNWLRKICVTNNSRRNFFLQRGVCTASAYRDISFEYKRRKLLTNFFSLFAFTLFCILASSMPRNNDRLRNFDVFGRAKVQRVCYYERRSVRVERSMLREQKKVKKNEKKWIPRSTSTFSVLR